MQHKPNANQKLSLSPLDFKEAVSDILRSSQNGRQRASRRGTKTEVSYRGAPEIVASDPKQITMTK
jgi:hypothetical protein